MCNKNENYERNNSAAFDCMTVTDVQVFLFTDNISHMKGLANIVLNDQLLIRGLRIMDGANGLFVGYPNDPFYKGDTYRSLFLPLTRQLREHIEHSILQKFNEKKE